MAERQGTGLRTADGRRPVVAVIDGNPATAAVASMLAEQFGCRSVAAGSVEAALATLKREEVVDLVLLDFAITDMDPIVAAQLIRVLGPRGAMPIVAIARTLSHTVDARARSVGFARTVAAPYSPRELYEAMEASLGHRASPAMPKA